MTNKAASVKARLNDLAHYSKKEFLGLLVLYGLEGVIRRVYSSRYADDFTLKGEIFLCAFFKENFSRATSDIDFLAKNIKNSVQKMEDVFKEILQIEIDDGLIFDFDTLKISTIAKDKK